jgi:pimeloyl-ACP methyl ester carboxylesterase
VGTREYRIATFRIAGSPLTRIEEHNLFVDLVQTTTQDGIRLDGIFQESPSDDGPTELDAACFIHGTGGNFYSSALFEYLSQQFLKNGCSVLRANTRGHDGISTAVTEHGGRRIGAAYEVVDDCRQDIAAWLNWLKQLGCERIALVGHSLGAVKSIYALAQQPDLPVTCLVALSPPRLSYSWFCASDQREDFLQTFQAAEQLVMNGQASQLMEVALPLPFVITAAGYVEKYGPEERYNFLRFVSGIRCPLLLTLGSVESENNMAFRGSVEALRSVSPRPRRMTVETIAGGDHFYTGVRDELGQALDKWLRSV